MTKIKEEDYAYATARVRAVEVRLLDGSKLERMLDAPTVADCVKQISDLNYGEGSVTKEGDWEGMLDAEMTSVYNFLLKLMPDPEVLEIFRLRDDYLNIKLILKSLYKGQDISTAARSPGTIPLQTLTRSISDRRFSSLPETMGKAIVETMAEFGKRSDPRDIDLVLDRALFKHMTELAFGIQHPFVTEVVALMTDMSNIRIFVRAKLIGEGREFLRRAVLSGGLIDIGRFRDASEKSMEAFLESIRHTWFGEAAIAGMEGYKAGLGITWLEKKLDDRLMTYIRRAKYIAMGVEPMIGYLSGKETEIRNIRMIMTGKVNGLSQDDIRERLRMAYV